MPKIKFSGCAASFADDARIENVFTGCGCT